ncbi:thiamine pyrophosphate-binding protein [Actinomycetospora endophytica]|uniref:Thiamine pyrophosphate-binding protein n=1 Tax=Actinomycetospora endophytica TaxID=2291215 RepID=A0ABS8PIR8_9PSEU|nr:thiamine pyrophosphate-binding protein [Actinomycetospora endophytica]MCD2197390.1 thiamine pyrophosphate-binding protein [Actinomycetospora endophytica]
MNPAAIMLDLLRDEGVDRVFGNPGTTELPLLRELAGTSDPSYVLALQEFSAVSAADGYARGTGRPAFVSVHAVPGVSNALIGLNNARRSRTPLVVTAGQQDQRFLRDEPMLGGDLVGLASSACLSAEEIHTPGDLLPLLRRAFARVRRQPSGPAFLSIPMNLLGGDGWSDELALPARIPVPDVGAATTIDEAAAVLASAERPAILAGDRVGATGAIAELTAVAEALGATVYPQPQYEYVDADSEHPLTAPSPFFTGTEIAKALAGHDVLLVAGAAIRPQTWTADRPMPDGMRVVQLDDDPGELGRSYPVEVAMAGAIGPSLAALASALTPGSQSRRETVERRAGRTAEALVAERTAWRERARAGLSGAGPIESASAAQAVADALAPGSVVVEEAPTSGPDLRRALVQRAAGDYHNSSGNGGLGWGAGAAVGLALAHPSRPVVGFLGDGSAMFGVQGLWTAARVGAPVTYVVVDNGGYRAVSDALPPGFAGTRLGGVDWAGLAESMGLRGTRVERGEEIGPAVAAAQRSGEPSLVVVPIAGGQA